MFLRYRIQYINNLNQKILTEQTFVNKQRASALIKSMESGNGVCLIFDNRGRTLKGKYLSHTVEYEGQSTVYKAYFKVKLHKETPQNSPQ